MTVLHLDPPPSHLHLVADAGPLVRDRRYRSGITLKPTARSLHTATVRYALANAQPLDADALRVVLAARQHSLDPDEQCVFWADDVWALMFTDIVTWCAERELVVPQRCAKAFELLIETVQARGWWTDESDSFDDVRAALHMCTGGWHGRDEHNSIRSTGGRRR